ncbi:hypothetical protein GCM10020001_083890 [Nonomuraea salmonea]
MTDDNPLPNPRRSPDSDPPLPAWMTLPGSLIQPGAPRVEGTDATEPGDPAGPAPVDDAPPHTEQAEANAAAEEPEAPDEAAQASDAVAAAQAPDAVAAAQAPDAVVAAQAPDAVVAAQAPDAPERPVAEVAETPDTSEPSEAEPAAPSVDEARSPVRDEADGGRSAGRVAGRHRGREARGGGVRSWGGAKSPGTPVPAGVAGRGRRWRRRWRLS